MDSCCLLLFLLFLSLPHCSSAQIPGFVSLDCGGIENFTDDIGLQWTSDNNLNFGSTASISTVNETRKQYTTLRYFPDDSMKYCYSLGVVSRTRYLVRATFLYGNFDDNNVYPKFDISLGATHWTTIIISDANTVEIAELIFLASSSTISVCLSNAMTGKPFISTLELRQFNSTLYVTDFEDRYYLSVSARINFGAQSVIPVRYPDDPFDRIWESDLLKKANYLVDVAAGTQRISTSRQIDVSRINERPPEKVMQTAVVGSNGSLTYRLNLDGFPGFGWAFSYFAEIEELNSIDSRKFRLVLPGQPEMSKAVVNIQENALGNYRAYEPGYPNVSLPFVLSFEFVKTSDSTLGPLLNAMEINKYVAINEGCVDESSIVLMTSLYPSAGWAKEGGDPCLPVPWSWVECSLDLPPKIAKIFLSFKNLTGNMPADLTKLTGLVELWMDNNFLTGVIPDFSACTSLKIIHLENNMLIGSIPSFFTRLPNLKELYLQNNRLSGSVPSGLLVKNLFLNYSGNINLHPDDRRGRNGFIITGICIGVAALLMVTITLYIFLYKRRTRQHVKGKNETPTSPPVQTLMSASSDVPTEAAHCFTLSEIEAATNKFEKKIGSGGFGVVYYGQLKDGREVAVKVLSSNTYQGKREFTNEIALLSRIHHRNLVQFLGFCQDDGKSMLIYEYMHSGALKEHLHGSVNQGRNICWNKRLEIAEDAAKGIEYLHTGCIPAIIHRDLKTSNILVDKHMRAKVSDFGLSKLAVEGVSHVSSIVRGTVGYLDPEYYISQQLTDKSDVYSFGVILLELISGREAISNESFGSNCRNIVQWAKLHIEGGDIKSIVDPTLSDQYDIQSMWKIAETALSCVQPHGHMRPSISVILKEIQDALLLEREAVLKPESLSMASDPSSLSLGAVSLLETQSCLPLDDSFAMPSAR